MVIRALLNGINVNLNIRTAGSTGETTRRWMSTTENQDGRSHKWRASTTGQNNYIYHFLAVYRICSVNWSWWGVYLVTRCWLIVKIVSPAALQQTHIRLCHWLPQQRPLQDERRIHTDPGWAFVDCHCMFN